MLAGNENLNTSLVDYDDDDEKCKPLLRGHFHQSAFFAAMGAGAMLIAWAPAGALSFYAAIYTLGLGTLFGISALYHRPTWGPVGRRWMRRFDHSGIFFFIGVTFTPICRLGLPGSKGIQMLNLIWMGCSVGIAQSMLWLKAPKWWVATLCVIVGWLAFPFMAELNASMGLVNTQLLFLGGLIYTIGAAIYALRRPDPIPTHFGYHEIFHLLVVIASIMHFVLIHRLIFKAV